MTNPGYLLHTENSPFVGCKCSDGSIIASDLVALLRYSKEYFVLEEGTIARLTENEISITDFQESHQVQRCLLLHGMLLLPRKTATPIICKRN